MTTVTVNPKEMFAAMREIPPDVPVFMLNLLRYRERADYGDREGMTPCSGREAYHQGYIPEFLKLAPPGVERFFLGPVLAPLAGPPEERWDEVMIVKYNNFATFQRIVMAPKYNELANVHRLAALEDWRLIATTKIAEPPRS
jgi:hypothetical protein